MPNPHDYTIEDDIPFPDRQRTTAGRKPIYPFNRLKVGQSFFVPSKKQNWSDEQRLVAAYHKARETMGLNLDWDQVDGGFRIWRRPGEAETKKKQKPLEGNERAA